MDYDLVASRWILAEQKVFRNCSPLPTKVTVRGSDRTYVGPITPVFQDYSTELVAFSHHPDIPRELNDAVIRIDTERTILETEKGMRFSEEAHLVRMVGQKLLPLTPEQRKWADDKRVDLAY